MSEPCAVLLTEAPVRVTGATKEPLRLAHDVARYSALDLELQIFEGTNIELCLLTSMHNESEDGWIEVDRFAPTSAPGALRKSFFPLLRYARWEALSSGAATFLLHGLGRRRLGFLPTDVDNCVVWLRADLGITLVSGDVSSWADKSGHANGVSQATSSKRPAYLANAVARHPALKFDGIDDNLKGTLAATFAGTEQEFTIFVVANVDATTPGGSAALYEISDSLSSTNRGPMHFYEFTTNYRWRCFTTSSGQATYSNPPFDSWHRHCGWHETTERRVYLDNVEMAASTTDVNSRDLTVHSVGLLRPDGTATYPLKGELAEVIAYQRKLSIPEMTLVDDYLCARYRL